MKTLAVLCAAIVALAAGLTLPAMGQTPTPTPGPETGTVDATISTELIAITVNPNTVDYGDLEAGTTNNEPTPGMFDVTNVGSVSVDLGIRGGNTTTSGTTPWILAGTPDEDQYVHKVSTSSGWASPMILTTSPQSIFLGVAEGPANAKTIFLRLDMPTQVTSFGDHTAPVIVTATKAP
jgi:hypothetical protein